MNTSSSKSTQTSLNVEIDTQSGFCFGVVRAIRQAEDALKQGKELYSLGDIVHNGLEVARLSQKGMKSIDHNTLEHLDQGTILFRAHGEPPESYDRIKTQHLDLIDATCPVVLKLQERIKKAWLEMKSVNGQIVIYGKRGHAEVKGLTGQTNHEAIVIESLSEIDRIDNTRPTVIFSQTTKNPENYQSIVNAIKERAFPNVAIRVHNTICQQVSGRVPHLRSFAQHHQIVIFVGGVKSSNARVLYETCKATNPNTFFVSSPEDLQPQWFNPRPNTVGICGATSTPYWLMKQVATTIENY